MQQEPSRRNESTASNVRERRPFVVVLTGGIASGKTAVSERFGALGVPVVDTDVIARAIVEPGEPALQEIAAQFGPEFLDAQGALDRRRMREVIFSDPASKARLEAILHPRIGQRAREEIAAVDAPYVLLVVPLLVEASRKSGSSYRWADRVLVVDADEQTQLDRLTQRDGVSREQAESALSSQSSRADRLTLADDVIRNEGSLDALNAKVAKLHAMYSELARRRC